MWRAPRVLHLLLCVGVERALASAAPVGRPPHGGRLPGAYAAAGSTARVGGRQGKAKALDLATFETKALNAAAKAEAEVQEIQRLSDENNAVVPLVQGQAAEAKTALKTAQDAVAEATRIVDETRAATEQAATQAAQEYLLEVKKAGAEAAKKSAAARAAAESKAEVAAAKAAAKAAEPYHTAIIRGAKVEHEYLTRANELAAASNALKEQAITLQGSAAEYQWKNFPLQAMQLQIQADELMREGEIYKQEAQRLSGVSSKINDLIPAYDEAAGMASEQAFNDASGADIPQVDVPYLLQIGRLRRVQPAGP